MSTSWFSHALKRVAKPTLPRPSPIHRSFRPNFETLEDRCVPATIMVTTTADDTIPNDGSVSLLEAILAINQGNSLGDPDITAQNPGKFGVNDTINFTSGLSGTISLNDFLPVNDAKMQPITIDGSGASIAISGQNYVPDFNIAFGQTATINHLNILGGAYGGGGISNRGILHLTNSDVEFNSGGGIINWATGSLWMTNDTVSGNTGAGIYNSGFANLVNCTVANNSGPSGGIANEVGGILSLTNCTVNGNSSPLGGGGIFSSGTLSMTNDTVSGNSANIGGGIYVNQGTATLTNCTVAYNTVSGAGADGGGIYNLATLILLNTIVYNTGSVTTQDDVFGSITQSQGSLFGSDPSITFDIGFNQFGTNPNLGSLQDNGGPTQTMAPQSNSTAIGHGVKSSFIGAVPMTDQRGYSRPAGTGADIGAFQVQKLTGISGRVQDSGEVWIAQSTGSGFATSLWASWSPAAGWVDVQTGNFSGHGNADIVGRDAAGNWWVGVSTGSSFATSLWGHWSSAVTWVDVHVGDFTGDGKADIAGRVLQTGQWWVAESTGTGFVSALWATWNPNATWVDVNVGHFLGGGKDDIAGRVLQTGQWWVAESTGTGFVSALWATWNPNVTWRDVKVGDFDGNGKSDIAGRVLETGQWWVGLSAGTYLNTSLWATWNPNVTWVDGQVGDFNGDGQSDIIGRVLETGQWYVGLSNGTSFSNKLWATWSPAVTWVDVQVGDFNGDGRSDITGRVLQAGQWWTGLSNGTGFDTSLWGSWSSAVTWTDVKSGVFS
jgi:hypothetical protein